MFCRISPKLIDVDNNRIETTDDIKQCELVNFSSKGVTIGERMNLGASGLERETIKDGRIYIPNKNGRFPTQLFTNIKNDRYKYVKNIT